jgi:hypothetical protein
VDQGISDWTGAFALRSAYVLGACIDWYLPSREELKLMYDNLHQSASALGGFYTTTASAYWGSTEDGALDAIAQAFDDGGADFGSKTEMKNVRAARAF